MLNFGALLFEGACFEEVFSVGGVKFCRYMIGVEQKVAVNALDLT